MHIESLMCQTKYDEWRYFVAALSATRLIQTTITSHILANVLVIAHALEIIKSQNKA